MENFNKSSIDSIYFQVEDVESDNACFYRSLANGLAFISENPEMNISLKEPKFGFHQRVHDFYGNKSWGFSGNNQEYLARDLQQLSVDWITDKRQLRAPLSKSKDGLNITIEELILMVHDLSYDEYLEQYKYFAGDIIVEKDDNSEEIISILDNRWGGYVEQVAISQQIKVPIVVLTAQKYDNRLEKLITGRIHRNKPIKGVRFKVNQTTGLEYLSRDKPIVYLLWKKTKNGDHYMAVYPKNHDVCKELIREHLEGF